MLEGGYVKNRIYFVFLMTLAASCKSSDVSDTQALKYGYRISISPNPNEAGKFTELKIQIHGSVLHRQEVTQEIVNNLALYNKSTETRVEYNSQVNSVDTQSLTEVLVSLRDLPGGWYVVKITNLPFDKYLLEFMGDLIYFVKKDKGELFYEIYLGDKKFIKYIWNEKTKYPHGLNVEISGSVDYRCFENLELKVGDKLSYAQVNGLNSEIANVFWLNFPNWNAGEDFQLNFDFSDARCELTDKDGSKKFSKQYKYAEAYNLGDSYR